MTTTLGPYEARGAYGVLIESEQFDTSGTGRHFCPNCEHEPCVAGRKSRCFRSPRAITAAALQDRIEHAIGPLHQSNHPAWVALINAVIELGSIAGHRVEGYASYLSDDALHALTNMAKALEQKPEATA